MKPILRFFKTTDKKKGWKIGRTKGYWYQLISIEAWIDKNVHKEYYCAKIFRVETGLLNVAIWQPK